MLNQIWPFALDHNTAFTNMLVWVNAAAATVAQKAARDLDPRAAKSFNNKP